MMLTAKLVDSIKSSDISTSLALPQVSKLIIVNTNNDVLVYYRDQYIYKHLQTYPNLMKHLHTNEKQIYLLKYSHHISTIFAQCDKTIILLNSSNLSQYDYIFDKRGVDQMWVFDIRQEQNNDETTTILMYSTKSNSTIRCLIWDGTIYREMIDVSFFNRNERVLSALAFDLGILIATKHDIYVWKYNETKLTKIDKIVTRSVSNNLLAAVEKFQHICHKEAKTKRQYNNGENSDNTDVLSMKSFYSTTSKQKTSGYFWGNLKAQNGSTLSKTRYVFKTSKAGNPIIFDGITQHIFELERSRNGQFFLVSSECLQFIEWNHDYNKLLHVENNVLLLQNSINIKFVDAEQGFTFLTLSIEHGVKDVLFLDGPFFAVITEISGIQIYRYQVDDSFEHNFHETGWISHNTEDQEYFQLWKKVLFYKFFLTSSYAIDICASDNPNESLDLCAMKLRDLVVVLCLKIFERCQISIRKIYSHDLIPAKLVQLQEFIMKHIFQLFITYWAPPQLVLMKTLPKEILKYIMDDLDDFKLNVNRGSEQFTEQGIDTISPKLLLDYYVPYLIDIRRHIKNINNSESKGETTWKILGREINQTIDFFLVNNHGDTTIFKLLSLLDTTLFEIYFHYNKLLLGPFLRVHNYASTKLVVSQLKEHNLFQDLIDYYFELQEHSQALEFLKHLYNTLSLNSDKRILNGILLLIISYLKKIPNDSLDLMFQYSKWLLEIYDDKISAVTLIFMQNTEVCKNRDHKKIYHFIDEFDPDLAMHYIEFIISSFKLKNNQLQLILIKIYLSRITDSEIRQKLRLMLQSFMIDEPRSVLALLDDAIKSAQLSQGEYYNYLKHLKIYPLRKLKEDKQSISILFSELGNYTEASQYATAIYKEDNADGIELLLYFFHLIIEGTDNIEQNECLIYFLKEFGTKIPTKIILQKIPKCMNVRKLSSILLKMIQLTTLRVDEGNLTKSIVQVELINESNLINAHISENYTIKESDNCSVCEKSFSAFTNESVSVVYSNGINKIVHTSCAKILEAQYSKLTSTKTKTLTVADFKHVGN